LAQTLAVSSAEGKNTVSSTEENKEIFWILGLLLLTGAEAIYILRKRKRSRK